MRAERRRAYGAVPIPIACLCLFALQIYAFRWGVITPDTVDQYRQALTGRYEDWHPPIMAWIWRQLIDLVPGSAPMLVLDCALYWLGLGLLAEGARRAGRAGAAAAILAVGALPVPFGQLGAILKDSLLAACLMAAAGLAGVRLVAGRKPGPAAIIAGTALLTVGAAARFNAPFAAAPLLLLCLRPQSWESGWRSALVGTIAAGLFLAGGSFLINRVLLQPKRQHPMLSLVNFDLAGIAVNGGTNVYPPGAHVDPRLVARCYDPSMFNPADARICHTVEDRLDAATDEAGKSVTRAWLGAIASAPLAYARHRALHFNANQRWLVGQVPDDAVYSMSQDNDLGLHFQPGALTDRICDWAKAMAESPFGRPATWLAVAAALLIVGAGGPEGAAARALAASAFLYGSGYALVSVAPDLRYNLWTMIAAMLALVLAARPGALAAVPRARLAAGAALPFIVVVGECAMLLRP